MRCDYCGGCGRPIPEPLADVPAEMIWEIDRIAWENKINLSDVCRQMDLNPQWLYAIMHRIRKHGKTKSHRWAIANATTWLKQNGGDNADNIGQ